MTYICRNKNRQEKLVRNVQFPVVLHEHSSKSQQGRMRLKMKSSVELLLLLMLVAVSSSKSKESNTNIHKFLKEDLQCSDNSSCLTWFLCNAKKKCQCNDGQRDGILCDNQAHISVVLNCNCVTYNKDKKSTYVGGCFYNCASGEWHHTPTHKLPRNPEIFINNSVCTRLNRTGLLCGDCEEGYSPLVLSYNLSCVECPDGHKNWWKFILAGFVPLTVFYFFILAFNINVTSSRLHGVVWYSQLIAMPNFV